MHIEKEIIKGSLKKKYYTEGRMIEDNSVSNFGRSYKSKNTSKSNKTTGSRADKTNDSINDIMQDQDEMRDSDRRTELYFALVDNMEKNRSSMMKSQLRKSSNNFGRDSTRLSGMNRESTTFR